LKLYNRILLLLFKKIYLRYRTETYGNRSCNYPSALCYVAIYLFLQKALDQNVVSRSLYSDIVHCVCYFQNNPYLMEQTELIQERRFDRLNLKTYICKILVTCFEKNDVSQEGM
jgi:hypothetical protein